MSTLVFLGIVYFLIGLGYGLFILFKGKDPWYMFPINVLGGPIAILYIIYATYTGRKMIS